MAKTTAPLLGFGASGQIGKTMVYGSWRGRGYARRHVIPANPKTVEQEKTRNVFKYLVAVFKQGSADLQAPWIAAAKGRVLTGPNYIQKTNIPLLRGAADNTAFVGSPGANGGLTAESAVGAVVAHVLTVTITPPTLPVGWTVASGVLLALPKHDPATETNYISYTNVDSATPFTPNVTLPAGDYTWSAWLTYNKPDGSLAYGPSTQGVATS